MARLALGAMQVGAAPYPLPGAGVLAACASGAAGSVAGLWPWNGCGPLRPFPRHLRSGVRRRGPWPWRPAPFSAPPLARASGDGRPAFAHRRARNAWLGAGSAHPCRPPSGPGFAPPALPTTLSNPPWGNLAHPPAPHMGCEQTRVAWLRQELDAGAKSRWPYGAGAFQSQAKAMDCGKGATAKEASVQTVVESCMAAGCVKSRLSA